MFDVDAPADRCADDTSRVSSARHARWVHTICSSSLFSTTDNVEQSEKGSYRIDRMNFVHPGADEQDGCCRHGPQAKLSDRAPRVKLVLERKWLLSHGVQVRTDLAITCSCQKVHAEPLSKVVCYYDDMVVFAVSVRLDPLFEIDPGKTL